MATGTFGERLKREREMREVSLKEVTSATRIGPRFLEALENEEWDKLPGGIFNRGFVRSIARFLGLDEENLLAEYDLARGDQSMPAPQPYENKLPRPPIWLPILAVLALLAVLGGLVAGGIYGWRWYSARRAARRSSSSALLAAPSQTGTSSAVPTAAAVPSSDSTIATATVPLDLAVSTSAATRVRILADGTVLLDAEIPAGETHHFSAARRGWRQERVRYTPRPRDRGPGRRPLFRPGGRRPSRDPDHDFPWTNLPARLRGAPDHPHVGPGDALLPHPPDRLLHRAAGRTKEPYPVLVPRLLVHRLLRAASSRRP